MKQQVHLNIV